MHITKIWVAWLKPKWNNFRFRKSIREYTPLSGELHAIGDLREKVKELYNNFNYKYDDASMLFDAIDTPPQCLFYLENNTLQDDCDGYHAAIHHLVTHRFANATNIRLITVVTKPFKKSHTMCVFDFEGKTYLADYQKVIEIQDYDKVLDHMKQVYSCEPVYYHLNTWDVRKGWK